MSYEACMGGRCIWREVCLAGGASGREVFLGEIVILKTIQKYN